MVLHVRLAWRIVQSLNNIENTFSILRRVLCVAVHSACCVRRAFGLLTSIMCPVEMSMLDVTGSSLLHGGRHAEN